MVLSIVFYFGTVLGWKGFNGLDRYITETIAQKDFKTLTGRTKIWAAMFKACIDNPIHIIFGHGFMVSQKQTLAITASIFPGTNGVRTAHNGYIQVLFEFGAIGALFDV